MIEVVCHRGANALAPENTYASSQYCIDWGADWLEIDVNTSADGVMYVFHGPDLARTTNGQGSIHAMQSQDVDQLDCGSWFAPQYAGARVPRLEDFLQWVNGRIKIFLDVKRAPLDHLVRMIDDNRLRDRCFLWFGDDSLARQLRAIDSSITLKINIRLQADLMRAKADYDAKIVEFGLSDGSAGLVAACRRAGVRSMIKYSGHDPAALQSILDLKPDMANIDYANAFLELRSGAP